MFALDDRAGNVFATIAIFLAAAGSVYLARKVLLVLFIALLLAYLLDPALTWLERHQLFKSAKRTWAIAEVYVLGTVLMGGLVYRFGAHIAAGFRRGAVPVAVVAAGSGLCQLAPHHGSCPSDSSR